MGHDGGLVVSVFTFYIGNSSSNISGYLHFTKTQINEKRRGLSYLMMTSLTKKYGKVSARDVSKSFTNESIVPEGRIVMPIVVAYSLGISLLGYFGSFQYPNAGNPS